MPSTSSPPSREPDLRSAWWSVAGNSGWLFAEKAARWVVAFTVGVWMARHLGPDGFGALNYALSIVALFASVVALGTDAIAVRELVCAPDHRQQILGTLFWLRVIGGVVATIILLTVAAVTESTSAGGALVSIVSFSLLLASGEVFDFAFQAELRARTAATARTAALIVASLARVGLILADAGVEAFAWLVLVETGLTSVALLAASRRGSRGSPFLHFSARRARTMLGECWPNIISSLAVMAYMRVDRIMLGEMHGDHSVGLYSAASTLVEPWYVIPTAVVASATPLITRLHGTDRVAYLRELGRLARMLAAIALSLALGLSLVMSFLLPVVFGAGYEGASGVLAILAWSLPFAYLGSAASPWFLNERLFVPAMWRHMLGAAINICLNLLLIPRWGPVGAAAGTTLSLAVAHVLANAINPRTRPAFRLQLRALTLQPPKSPS